MTPPVRVVIADDHPMFRHGLRAVLAASPGVQVVGEATDGRELLAAVDQTGPDVVLTDLAMPGMDGVTAARRIRQSHPGVAVLVLTMHEEDAAVFGALRAGASGYLLKGADQEEIVRAVLAVAAGQAIYGRAVELGEQLCRVPVGGTGEERDDPRGRSRCGVDSGVPGRREDRAT